MKHVLQGAVISFVIVLLIVILMALHSRDIRQNELNDAVSQSAQEAVYQAQMSEKYHIDNDDELKEDFTEILLGKLNVSGKVKQVGVVGNERIGKTGKIEGKRTDVTKVTSVSTGDPNFKLQVTFTQVNYDKGLLSVHVKEWYSHPNGKIGSNEAAATAIAEREVQRKTVYIKYIIPYKYAKDAYDYSGNNNNDFEYKVFGMDSGDKAPVQATTDNIAPPKSYTKNGKTYTFSGWKLDTGNNVIAGEAVQGDVKYIAQYS
jgi:hypothetical protein